MMSDMMSGMMGGMGSMMKMGGMAMGGSPLWRWLLVLALVVVVVVVFFRLFRQRGHNRLAIESPLTALQRRFALGEINADEFTLMKTQLATK